MHSHLRATRRHKFAIWD